MLSTAASSLRYTVPARVCLAVALLPCLCARGYADTNAHQETQAKHPTVAILPFIPADRGIADALNRQKLGSLGGELSNYVVQALIKNGYDNICAQDVVDQAVLSLDLSDPKKKQKKQDDKQQEGLIPANRWHFGNLRMLAAQLHADYLVLPVIVKCERRTASTGILRVLNPLHSDTKQTARIRAWILDVKQDLPGAETDPQNDDDLTKLLGFKREEATWFEAYRERISKSIGKEIEQLPGYNKKNKPPLYSDEGYVCRLAADKLSHQLIGYFLEGSGAITRLNGAEAVLEVGATSGVKQGESYTLYKVDEKKDKDGNVVFQKFVKAGVGEIVGFVDKPGREQGRALLRVGQLQPGMKVEVGYVARPSRLPPLEDDEPVEEEQDKKQSK